MLGGAGEELEGKAGVRNSSAVDRTHSGNVATLVPNQNPPATARGRRSVPRFCGSPGRCRFTVDNPYSKGLLAASAVASVRR